MFFSRVGFAIAAHIFAHILPVSVGVMPAVTFKVAGVPLSPVSRSFLIIALPVNFIAAIDKVVGVFLPPLP